ncbi:MAG: hypothetical protein HYY14_00955 [Candidatus Omnitrophica bacterium]|nr:hypothetical protein [Candidatus Omnitrophota bacterium]
MGIAASMVTIGKPAVPKALVGATALWRGENETDNVQWRVAHALRSDFGIQAGDSIAHIGNGFEVYWARLARVRIVAEIPQATVLNVWTNDPDAPEKAVRIFREAGARCIVRIGITRADAERLGWKRIDDADDYFYPLTI